MIIREKEGLAKLNTKKPLIIMLPFAGGNTYSFTPIIKKLNQNIDVLCPELPGRGGSSDEAGITDIKKLIDSIFINWIKPIDLKRPYILYGHSMGGLGVYLLLHRIIAEGLPLPFHLVVSGRSAPSFIKQRPLIYPLPSSEFWTRVREIGGTSAQVLADKELMEYFEPILRCDFEAVETYVHHDFEKLDIPITAFYGSEEENTFTAVNPWKNESSKFVEIKEMSGNHFFIFDHVPVMAAYLSGLFN